MTRQAGLSKPFFYLIVDLITSAVTFIVTVWQSSRPNKQVITLMLGKTVFVGVMIESNFHSHSLFIQIHLKEDFAAVKLGKEKEDVSHENTHHRS